MTYGITNVGERAELASDNGSKLEPEAFARRAEAIVECINEHRDELGLNGAITAAHERFVDDETKPELKHFSEVIVGARRQAVLQDLLDDDRETLHHGHLSHDEDVSLGHHYETLRHEACIYNHKLRSVIELSGHHFSRDDLSGWLIGVSQGRHHWERGETTGAISEVALHAVLQGMPELKHVRYGSVEEDLLGYDFVAELEGQLLTIDAKTGRYWPLAERKHGHRHLEVSVPREAIIDFRIARSDMQKLRAQVRAALGGQLDPHLAPAPTPEAATTVRAAATRTAAPVQAAVDDGLADAGLATPQHFANHSWRAAHAG